jgi:hypothetical protein
MFGLLLQKQILFSERSTQPDSGFVSSHCGCFREMGIGAH